MSRHHNYTKAEMRLIYNIKRKVDFKCEECGSGYKVQAHHIRPVSQGGKTTADNLAVLCFDCHRSKHRSKPKDPWFDLLFARQAEKSRISA